MTTNRDILTFLQTIAPPELAESWDNNGLLCGRMDAPVTKILVALDPFESVAREAVDSGAQLVVSHHPLIFHPAAAVNDETALGRTLLWLIEHGIAAMNAHTCLDAAPGGTNDRLARTLGLEDIRSAGGLWRMGSVPKQPAAHFAAVVKHQLKAGGVRFADAGRPVQTVAVCGGAGMDFLQEVFDAGCDTFVTADVKYNGFWDAVDLGINLIDAGHFPTENPVVQMLAEALRAAFPTLEVAVSQRHRDIVQFE